MSQPNTLPEIFEKFQSDRKELARLLSYYRCAIMEIETKFKVLNDERLSESERNPIESIKSRLKTPESILEKLIRRGFPLTVESIEQNLNDVAGVRVICAFIEDVYELSDVLLRQDDIRLIQKKDYIANPKPNGYRSLHLIVTTPIFLAEGKHDVKVEIQLRTMAMDFWASLEHDLNYKKNFDLTPEIIDELSACASASAALDARMNVLKHKVLDPQDATRPFLHELLRKMIGGGV